MNEYDTVLLGIFLSMLAGTTAGLVTALPLNATVSIGGMMSFIFMYHGLFRKAPL